MSELAYHKVDTEKRPAPDGCPVDHEFSPYNERYVAFPYAWLNEKREAEPIFYSEELGYVVVTRMEDVEEIFKSPDIFSTIRVFANTPRPAFRSGACKYWNPLSESVPPTLSMRC